MSDHNTYWCEAYIPSGCGCCPGDEYDEIIGAATKAEALGFALMEHPCTKACHWDIQLIDTTQYGVHVGWR